MRRNREVTLEAIEQGMLNFALLVDRYGEEMMPFLERLEREYAKSKAHRDAGKQVDRIKALLAADKAPPPA